MFCAFNFKFKRKARVQRRACGTPTVTLSGAAAPVRWRKNFTCGASYSLSSSGGPLTRFSFRWKSTSTWSAILMNGMPLFIP
jgi:hypothetical protein